MIMKSRTIGPKLIVLVAMLGLAGIMSAGCDNGRVGAKIVGDISVDPDNIPASGNAEAEVAVWVYMEGAARRPLSGATVEIFSSRNQNGNVIDLIEQPAMPTDADGRAVAFIGSPTVGEAGLVVKVNQTPLCEYFEAGECVRLQKIVNFYLTCEGNLTNCNNQCVDTESDLNNCGGCDNLCDFENAEAICDAGQCEIGNCELGFDDCNADPSDGCEINIASDRENCGLCGNLCDPGLGCADGECSVTCYDDDNDTYYNQSCGGNDCNDADANIYPGADEVCDGQDNDCDEEVDELPEAQDSCDDANDCTNDVCQRGRGCANLPMQEGACDDGDDCTMNDTCRSGLCNGTPLDGDLDGYQPPECGGNDCNDANASINPGSFEGAGIPATCQDGLDNNCNGLTDAEDPPCNPCETDLDCDDQNLCNGVERCINSTCQQGIAVDCNDDNVCTDDTCNQSTGACEYANNTGACEDGDACTVGDTCSAGVCQSGSGTLDCNDGNECTDDSCLPASGCSYVNNTIACEDGNPCSLGDMCSNGFCQPGSSTLVCNDDNLCTDDSCDPGSGCVFAPNTAPCDDGDLCTQDDTCGASACQPGTPLFCDDGDDCTDNNCDTDTGTCVYPYNTAACDDQIDCTVNDVCDGNGSCGGTLIDVDDDGFVPFACGGLDCDDTDENVNPGVYEGPNGDPLCADTIDNDCDLATDDDDPGCGPCVVDADCSDDNVCTGTETCVDSACQPGTPLTCDDGNDCTDDLCDAQTGCYTLDNVDPCDDGDLCTLTDACQDGACVGADPMVCTVLDQCHVVGVCNPATGICSNPNQPDGTACDDASLCTATDSCQGGICSGADPVICTALDSCHEIGTCNPASGICDNPAKPEGAGCDDGDACTLTDTCQSASCVGSNPVQCSAMDQCHLAGVCNPATGVCTDPTRPDDTPCDDADACTLTDTCQAGNCTGVDPIVCSASDQCHDVGTCDPQSGICSDPASPDGTVCDDGDLCTQTDECQIGICAGSNPIVCTPQDSCHDAGICNPGTGLCSNPPRPDGSACDDGDMCTQTDTCQTGSCSGSDPVVCTPLDQCHAAGTCNPATGICTDPNRPDGTGCDDGDLCTQTDTCQTGSCTGANPVICSASDQCHDVGLCNPADGLCSDPASPDGTACSDGNLCTQTDTCQSGSCTGANPVVCTPLDQCHLAGTCNPGTGNCSNPNQPDGTGCDDLNDCSASDTCVGGSCTSGATDKDTDSDTFYDWSCPGGNDCHDNDPLINPGAVEGPFGDPTCVDGWDNDCDTLPDNLDSGCMQCTGNEDCEDFNACTTDVCVAGECQNNAVADGTGCDDSDMCTQTDTCQSGTCTGANPVVCTPLDQCHLTGVCNPATGVCSDPVRPDDTPCDDGNSCTQTDTCQSGSCSGADPVVCTPLDQCHQAGVCNPGTGICSDPNQPDGTGCDDSDACTQTDSCQSGSCTGSNPVVCTALDQCHEVGTCNPSNGICSNPESPDGSGCDDGNLCTQTDTCQSGSCNGANPVTCTPLDQCHLAGVCNPGTGVCSNPERPNGVACDDSNACTQTDTCQSGSCVGADPVTCTPSDQCHDAGTCNPGTGLCSDPPRPDGSGCDDGDLCTQTDTCQTGSCVGANPVICTALDQCHDVGVCNPGSGVCSNPESPNGSNCDDGDLCTQTDTCQSGSCQGSNPVVCSPLDQCHLAGTCNPGTGICSNPNRPDGSACDDGNNCSSMDTCQSGSCTAGATDKDTDGDTYLDINCPGGNDCDDSRGFINPGEIEGPYGDPVCGDTWDNDCDTFPDMADSGCMQCQGHGDCEDFNVCTTDLCVAGECQNNAVADGTGCDDSDACTQTDTCQAGVCTGANPVVCTPLDQCHVAGVCNPGTGICTDPAKADGSACDDGDLCTQTDTCQAGACSGADPVICVAQDQCHDVGVCNPGSGVCSNPARPDGTACDDGNLCTQTDTCQTGSCTGANPVVCTPLDQCHNAGTCNPGTGVCSDPVRPDGSACDDGDACTQTDTCQSGSCSGANPVVCTPLDQCHSAGTCNPGTGVCSNPNRPDGTGCDDSNACTQTDTCQSGTCTGSNPVVCTPLDQCHDAGTCNPGTGICSDPASPDGTGCNDSNACTQTDTCQSGSCTGANPVVCTPLDQCHNPGVCNPGTGICSDPAKPDGSNCDDSDLCTQTDTCQSGSCVGANPVTCTPSDQCHNAGTCNPGTGICSDPARPDGSGCNDGDLCTQTDTCQSGVCTGANPVVCTPLDQCHVAGVCNPGTGICSNPNQPNGTSCNDGNICSSLDTCQGGVCLAGATDKDTDGDTYYDWSCPLGDDCNDNAILINPGAIEGPYLDPTCSDSDDNDCDTFFDMNDTGCMQCQDAGDCEDFNECTTDACNVGVCENIAVANGTGCDDSDMCTQTDTCQAGVCAGSNPVICTASDQCHNAGICNPGTGVCSDPVKPNGSPCDDSDECTQTDTCQTGSCQGADPVICTASDQCHGVGTCNPGTGVCSDPPLANGTPCNDGNLCTQTDTCQSGSCSGSNPVICTASDQCHEVGTCNPGTGICSDPPRPDGSGCNDGDLCTQTDTCQSGSCIGSNPITCTASDQCHAVGTCNPGTGVCSDPARPDGSGCDDSDACTQTDTCQSGVCTGSNPIICTPLDQCHLAGTCNPGTGICSNPNQPNGTGCNDGDLCTQTDECQGGVCTGSNPVVCTALDQCHQVGTCNPGTGICSNPNQPDGTGCDDLDMCTQTDTCQSGSCNGADPVVCLPLDQCHDPGTCNPGTGICSDPPKVDGSGCDDLDLCTQTDTCQGGNCIGSDPVICTPLDQCHLAGVCNPGTGVCSNPNQPDGTGCNDGDLCSFPDTCTGGVCGGTPYSCDDGSPCTDDSCDGSGGCDNDPISNPANYGPGHEWVEVTCADSIDNDCDGCTDEGCAGYSMPIVMAEVVPYSTAGGLRRISGNGQFGPIGVELPQPLIVQLNTAGGSPRKGEAVTFTVEALGGVCYGDAKVTYNCSDSAQGRVCPMPVSKVCNNALGTLLDESGSPASSLVVYTNDIGQAKVRIQLPDDDTGMMVVSADASGESPVNFFAASTNSLTNTITLPTAADAYPATNPSVGPLIQTKWPNDDNAPTYIAQLASYTLAITGLSSDNATCSIGEIPSETIQETGILTICGTGFHASNNTVWVGGIQIQPGDFVSQSTTQIRVNIPEGLPGAASVIVDDGTTTICKDDQGTDDGSASGFGWFPSWVGASANFFRTAPKPIFIFAQTGGAAGNNSANVRLLGMDECGNPLSLSGHTVNLTAYNPDKSTGSNAVTLGSMDADGIATVDDNGSGNSRAAVVIGTVNGISSDSLSDGNTVVSTIKRAGPGHFTQDPADNNNNGGKNAMLIRGADERNTSEMQHQNPALRLQGGYESVWMDTYRVPFGGPYFETEANIFAGTMTGEGPVANLAIAGYDAVAGTALATISGGPSGLIGVLAATVGIDPDNNAAGEVVMDVPPVVMPGWLRSPGPGGQQEVETFYNALLFFDDDEHPQGGYARGLGLRLLIKRNMP
jgi:slime mold repeat-containing protein